jgi:hypothetical protein
MSMRTTGLLVTAWILAGQFPSPSEWTKADVETVRLAPARFSGLPSAVEAELNRRQCSIPQPFTAKPGQPENAIRGRFTSSAAADWAVLCSRQRHSTLLVFRGGDVAKIDEGCPPWLGLSSKFTSALSLGTLGRFVPSAQAYCQAQGSHPDRPTELSVSSD